MPAKGLAITSKYRPALKDLTDGRFDPHCGSTCGNRDLSKLLVCFSILSIWWPCFGDLMDITVIEGASKSSFVGLHKDLFMGQLRSVRIYNLNYPLLLILGLN